jgi:hypothetical protein
MLDKDWETVNHNFPIPVCVMLPVWLLVDSFVKAVVVVFPAKPSRNDAGLTVAREARHHPH